MSSPSEERNYLSLNPLPITDLPDHPALEQHQTTSTTATTTAPPPPALQTFTANVLNEAYHFVTSTLPDKFQVKGSSRPSPPSTAQVDLLSADLPVAGASAPQTETWFARRSSHKDALENGTASWSEFEEGLFNNHSINEAEYTPEVFDARHVLHWDFARPDGASSDAAAAIEGWTDVGMDVFEMGHKIPPPLQNRVFALLVVRGKPENANGPHDFITAQMPVDLATFADAFYSNGRHRTEGDSAVKKDKVTLGVYTSVERVRKLDDGMIVWEMVLASDAKGWLPMGLQKRGVPAAIIKDVGYFIDWAQKRRQ